MILIPHNFDHGGFVPVAIVVLLYYTLSANQLVVGVLGWTIIAPSSSSSSATTTRAHRSIVNNYNNCHSSSITKTCLSSSSQSSPNTAILPTNDNEVTSSTSKSIEDEDEKKLEREQNKLLSSSLSDFQILAGNVGNCLIQSDLKRDSGFDGSSTGWTSWVDEQSAFRLQKCIDKLQLKAVQVDGTAPASVGSSVSESSSVTNQQHQQENDDILRWLRWFKSCPSSMVIELTDNLRNAVNETFLSDIIDLQQIVNQNDVEFLNRISLRLFILPSGASLANNLRTEPGAMIYGKLLYGGVTRYRMIGTQGKRMRKAGERTAIHSNNNDGAESWLQYGGTERNYDAIDMGPCAFIELTILPKGSELSLAYTGTEGLCESSEEPSSDNNGSSPSSSSSSSRRKGKQNLNVINEMTILQSQQCNPELLFEFQQDTTTSNSSKLLASSITELYNNNETLSILNELNDDDANYIEGLETTFTSVLGGLQNEVDTIIRRVLDGRALQLTTISRDATSDDSDDDTKVLSQAVKRANEMQEMLDLGLHPVRGLLLYGHPGCGKTALAREISSLLTDRQPKIVSAPELLDRWVGGSEKLVRDLFVDAETELRLCGNDPTKSALHVIVIDEIDAVFRKRSSSSDSGEVVRASAVNQILAKLDGVNALGNVLVIGTTNRRELLDPALLRPGRLEVQLEVPLPDREGRREILQIHFGPLRARGRLSRPLCEAIDGVSSPRNNPNLGDSEDETSASTSSFLSKIFTSSESVGRRRRLRDLAADRWTKGFSGADIAGLVRCAGSVALSRARRDGSGVDGLLITVEDVLLALKEVKQ